MPTTKTRTLGQAAGSAMQKLQRMAADPTLQQKIYDGLADLRMEDEQLAAELEAHYMARVQFLASKVPPVMNRNSPLAHAKDIPSDAEAAVFGRYLRAAEQPMTLLDDVANGSVSAEAVEAVQALYPRLYEEMRQKTAEKIVSLKSMPYHQRAAVTQAFGINAEPSLDPARVATINNYFAQGVAKEPEDKQPGERGGFTPKRKMDSEKLGPSGAMRRGK